MSGHHEHSKHEHSKHSTIGFTSAPRYTFPGTRDGDAAGSSRTGLICDSTPQASSSDSRRPSPGGLSPTFEADAGRAACLRCACFAFWRLSSTRLAEGGTQREETIFWSSLWHGCSAGKILGGRCMLRPAAPSGRQHGLERGRRRATSLHLATAIQLRGSLVQSQGAQFLRIGPSAEIPPFMTQ